MTKTVITGDPLRATGNILYAMGIITSIIALLDNSEISGSIPWILFGTITIGLGAILKEVKTSIKEE